MQAGLGGGSSDAAAALRALRALWARHFRTRVLKRLAAASAPTSRSSCDGGTVLGVERGDLLFPLQDRRRAWVVLARPDFGVSTKDAYSWWDDAYRQARGAAPFRQVAWRVGERSRRRRSRPGIARSSQLVRQLKRGGARYAAMSGSGSAVFGLFDDAQPTQCARPAASATHHTATWVTRTTNRREYLRAIGPTRA